MFMRKIKFRAWDEHTKEMYQDVTFIKEEGNVRPWVFMQYTAFKDKNGKEIYEGDIVRSESDMINIGTGRKTGKKSIRIYVIIWEKEKAMFNTQKLDGKNTNFNLTQKKMTKFYEIIGNIYENPELLNTENL